MRFRRVPNAVFCPSGVGACHLSDI
jgi:hypothetical protein